MDREIRRIAVIGGGAMGGGIAALCARRGMELKRKGQMPDGLSILVKEATDELCAKARIKVLGRFLKWRKLEKIGDKEVDELEGAVDFAVDHTGVADFGPDLVIEAIVEKKEAKDVLFQELDRVLPRDVIFASNTSTLPITELARATDREERFIGAHFFNPPTTMQLVEVIPGQMTSEWTVHGITRFAESILGKTTIRVKDQPGFLVNRLLLPYLSEAVLVLQEHRGCSFQEIDAAAMDMGWPMGPFKLLDTVGVDVAYFASHVMAAHCPEIVVPELFDLMVEEKRLGDKAGSGFYSTAPGQKTLADVLEERFPERTPMPSVAQVYRNRILAGMLRESVIALANGVASAEDIEVGAQLGLGCPDGGPLHIIDALGAGSFCRLLSEQSSLGPRFAVPELLAEMSASARTFFSAW